MDFASAQNFLFGNNSDTGINVINPSNSGIGITTPLSTLVAAANKPNNKKKSPPAFKCSTYPQMQEVKTEPNVIVESARPSGGYSFLKDTKPPSKPFFSPFIHQSGSGKQFDPKSIDFSALQLPNTPPKTSRNKKTFGKPTSSSMCGMASSTMVSNQQRQ